MSKESAYSPYRVVVILLLTCLCIGVWLSLPTSRPPRIQIPDSVPKYRSESWGQTKTPKPSSVPSVPSAAGESSGAWTTDPHEFQFEADVGGDIAWTTALPESERIPYQKPISQQETTAKTRSDRPNSLDLVSGHLECPRRYCSGTMYLRTWASGKHYGCSESPDCRMIIAHPFKCYRCKSGMVVRNGKYGLFWGCTTFPKCRHTNDHK